MGILGSIYRVFHDFHSQAGWTIFFSHQEVITLKMDERGVVHCVKEKSFLQMHVFICMITQRRPFERFSQEENTVSGDKYSHPHQGIRQITLFSSSRWCCSDCCCGHRCCRCRSSCNVMIFGIKLSPTLSWALITCQDGIAKIASLCNHRWYLWRKKTVDLSFGRLTVSNLRMQTNATLYFAFTQSAWCCW